MGKELEEEPEEEPKEEPLPPLYIPEEPSPILCGFYSAPGKFWLSLVNKFLFHVDGFARFGNLPFTSGNLRKLII